eukprot:EG_transcript_8943
MARSVQYGAVAPAGFTPAPSFVWNGGLPLPQYQIGQPSSFSAQPLTGWNSGLGFSYFSPYQPPTSTFSSTSTFQLSSLSPFPSNTVQYSPSPSPLPFSPPNSTYHLAAPALGQPPQVAHPAPHAAGLRARVLSLPTAPGLPPVASAGFSGSIAGAPPPSAWQPIRLSDGRLAANSTTPAAADRPRSRMLSAPATLRPAMSIPPPSPPVGPQSPPPTTLTTVPTFFPSTTTHQNYEQLRGENAQLRLELARMRLDMDALQTQLSWKQAGRTSQLRDDVRQRLSMDTGSSANVTPIPVPSYRVDSPMMDSDHPYPIVSPRGRNKGSAFRNHLEDHPGDSRSSDQPVGMSFPASPVKADVIVPQALRLRPIPMD